MAFGFKFGTPKGGAHRLSSKRGERAASLASVTALSEDRWEPLPPELEDWMGMNPFTGDHAQPA